MSDVPTQLFRLILIRVPAEPLLRLRIVCKAWRNIIDDPAFASSHLNLRRQADLAEAGQLIIKKEDGKLYTLSMNSLGFSGEVDQLPRNGNIKNVFPTRRISLPLPACDGLFLIAPPQKGKNCIWTLWNPYTGESFEFPKHDTTRQRFGPSTFGLGYDGISNDFKVISISSQHDCNISWMETFVYSLRLGNWKKIENFYENSLLAPYECHGVYLKGALHWISLSNHPIDSRITSVLCFDLGTESFNLMPLPSPLCRANQETYFASKLVLDVLGGALFLNYHVKRKNRYDLWMMKVYGEQSSWTKLYSTSIITAPMALDYCKSTNKVLINDDALNYVWFDTEDESENEFGLFGIKSDFTLQVFQPSLFRLGGKGDVVTSKAKSRKRKRVTDSLSLVVESCGFGPFRDFPDFD